MATRYRQAHSPQPRQNGQVSGQVAPESPQELPPRRRWQRPATTGSGAKAAIILLSIACVVLFLVLMGLILDRISLQDERNQSIWRANRLDEDNTTLDAQVRDLRAKLLAAGRAAGAVHGGAPGAAQPSRSREYYFERVRQLETELYAMKQAAKFYKAHIPKHVEDAMEFKQDVLVKDIAVSDGDNGLRVVFKVVNRVTMPMRNVSGNIRFWYGNRIIHESPFLIDRIEAQSSKRMYVEVPPMEYSDYDGHVKAGGSY